MTTDEKLEAFIAATNERLASLETRVDDIIKSLAIAPETKAQMDTSMERMRKRMEALGYFDKNQADEI